MTASPNKLATVGRQRQQGIKTAQLERQRQEQRKTVQWNDSGSSKEKLHSATTVMMTQRAQWNDSAVSSPNKTGTVERQRQEGRKTTQCIDSCDDEAKRHSGMKEEEEEGEEE